MAIPDFPNLETGFCLRLEEMAKLGLTKEEILQGYNLEWDQLTPEEQHFFKKGFARGVLEGKIAIANDLQKHSARSSGLPATMAYLRRFVQNYERGIDGDSTEGLENFQFFFNSGN